VIAAQEQQWKEKNIAASESAQFGPKCERIFSASAKEVEGCMHDCEIPTASCIENTPPMTAERMACLDKDADCKRSCAVAGRAGRLVAVPCD
jgi:hypothetical protein